MINKFNLFLITFFKVGKIKFAPGTISSLITCLLFLFLLNVFTFTYLLILTLLIGLYSIHAINSTFENFDSKDPQEIVIDEVIGQMLPLLAIPIYKTLYLLPNEYYCLGAFIFFRFFDILKPFPINYVDKNTTGALGIMFDDILAGIYTFLVITLACFYIGS